MLVSVLSPFFLNNYLLNYMINPRKYSCRVFCILCRVSILKSGKETKQLILFFAKFRIEASIYFGFREKLLIMFLAIYFTGVMID